MKFTKLVRTYYLIENTCLTRVFKGVWDKNQCDCLHYISDLAEKGICCHENPEAATAIFLSKKAYNFIKKVSSIAKFLRTPI